MNYRFVKAKKNIYFKKYIIKIFQGIVTHKGRSSNSGHYVGWVCLEENKWVKCDDDDVEPVSEEDVFRLSGGGDWHCAYLLLYGPRRLRILQ